MVNTVQTVFFINLKFSRKVKKKRIEEETGWPPPQRKSENNCSRRIHKKPLSQFGQTWIRIPLCDEIHTWREVTLAFRVRDGKVRPCLACGAYSSGQNRQDSGPGGLSIYITDSMLPDSATNNPMKDGAICNTAKGSCASYLNGDTQQIPWRQREETCAHFLKGACGLWAEGGRTKASHSYWDMMSDPYKPGVQSSFWHKYLTEWCVNTSDDYNDD